MGAVRRFGVAFATLLVAAVVAGGFGVSSAAGQTGASISGVVDSIEGPEDGVAVDLFEVDDQGNRTTWLASTTTGETGPGSYRFDVEPGCYKITFIAPLDETFDNNRTWLNADACAEAGQATTGINASLREIELSTITVQVLDQNGRRLAGVSVDLFTATADGNRGDWVTSGVTGSQDPHSIGEYRFRERGGCYVATFIAPEGEIFVQSGSPWFNRPFCVQPGEFISVAGADLAGPDDTGLFLKVSQDGSGLGGVVADLFADDSAGGRGEYIASATSDTQGRVVLPASPGCYVVTAVAPINSTWEANGQTWLNMPGCVEPARLTILDPAELSPAIRTDISVDVLVQLEGGLDAPPIQVDFFRAAADGGRGEFVTSGTTESGQESTFVLDPGSGCWVLTLVAPENQVFVSSGSGWVNLPFCTIPDQDRYAFVATLAGPPPNEVLLNLDEGPHPVSGQVHAELAVAYRIIGTPGALVAMEFKETSLSCFSSWPMSLSVRTDDGIIETDDRLTCGPEGPWTIPPEGALTIGLLSDVEESDAFPYSVVFAEVEYEDVDLPLVFGATRQYLGTLDTPGDGTDIVVTGLPGQRISFRLTDCDNGGRAFRGFALDSAERGLGRNLTRCNQFSLVEFPDDGIVKIRVQHHTLNLFETPEQQNYTLAVGLYEIERVVVTNEESEFEIEGSIDVPLDAIEYVFDTTGLDELGVRIIDNDGSGSGSCNDNGMELSGNFSSGEERLGLFSCLTRRPLDVRGLDTVTLRLDGPSGGFFGVGTLTGPYTLSVRRIAHDVVPVDLTAGPVDVTGTIEVPYDKAIFRITADPGSKISAATVNLNELGRCDFNVFYPDFRALDSAGERIDSERNDSCDTAGPWSVPADGILELRIGDLNGNSLRFGSFVQQLASFTYDRVEVNLADGPVDVSYTTQAVLDGTDYVIQGDPGDEFSVVVTDRVPDGCDPRSQLFEMALEISDGAGDLIESTDIEGCGPQGPWIIDQTGTGVVRAYTNGSIRTFSGGYTLRITKTE